MSDSISAQIQSLLLVSGKPLAFKDIAKALDLSVEKVAEAVTSLEVEFNTKESGIHVLVNNQQVQFTTNPDQAKLVESFLQSETSGELTKPSLETLTIIAYRQPITKEALEQIRGINCSLILRNLMIRGLVESREAKGGLTTEYSVTMDFLRFLGINKVEELPDYVELHVPEQLVDISEAVNEQNDAAS